MTKVILASQSPRRRELLKNLVSEFDIIPSDADETLPEGLSPDQCVIELSRRKATDIAKGREDFLIVGADTVVVYGDKILGKPRNEEEAFNMLTLLSGNTHTVYTGVTLCHKGKILSCAEATQVTFRSLSPREIRAYIATGEPMDKAGAYGIQEKGSLLVEGIKGDYFNVVGLPLCRLSKMFCEFDFFVL